MANQVDFKILPSDQFNVYSPQNRSEKVITYFTLLSKLRGDILSVSAEDDPNDIVSAYYSNTGGTQTLHLVKADGSEVTASQPQQIISGTVNYISKFTTSNDIGNSQVFDDGTNVGIGTTTMTHKLQLGTGGVFADYYQLDTTYSNGFVVGALSWDIDNGTMDVGLSSNLKLKVGQDDVWYVKNQTGSSIAKGTAVYASGTLGASSKILISPMIANGTIPAKFFLGIVAETIANGAEGYVLTKGKLRNINTSAYNEGDVLWVSPTTAGALTATEPTAPNLKLPVAFVVNKGNNGVLAIRATTGQRIADASDVDYAGASDNSFLVYNSSTGVWEDESVGIFKTIAVSGQSDVVADTYTDTLTLVAGTNVTITTNASTDSITINSTDQYVGTVTSVATTAPITGGTITTTGTIGITQSGASSDGYLSSTDWNTFNNKQGSLTFTAPLVNTSGTVTITQSGTASNGYLSSTDWNTFNNKASDAFKTIAVSGQSNIVADSATDTLTFEAGTNIVITTDAATDKITISAVGGGTGSVTSVDMSVPTGFAISGNPITTSGTLALAFASGYSLPTNASQGNWDTAYNNSITAFAYNTSTGVLTLTQQDAGTLTATVTLQPFSTTNLTEGTNLYFTTARARQSLSAGTGISYDNSTGVITNSAPDQIVSLTGGTGISTSGTYPSFTITNTLPDQTVVLTAGTGITTSGTYPNFTITNSDRGSSQNIFKNIAVAGQSTIVADSNDDTLTVASGTGISLATNATSDTLTITNTAPDQTVVLNAGTGISTSGTYPNFTITNTLPDQTVVLTGAGTTVVTGTYPSFTITSNDQYVGTVTSVATTAPITGGTITSTGTIGITQSGTASDGYLSSTDWNTFNAKIGGSGTTNYVAKFTGGSAIGNSQIFDNGTNVGIGTASPGYKLEVSGNIWAVDYFIQNSAGTGGTFRLDGYQDYLYFYGDSSAIAGYRFGSDTAGIKMQIGTNGNVGIGTTNPIYALDINNTGASTARVRVLATTNYSLLQAQNSSGVLYLGIDDSSGGGFTSGAYSRLIWSSGAYPLIFATNDVERVRITPGGTLLVGDTVVPGETAWLGTAVFGKNTYNKVIIGSLNSTTTGAYVGGHNSALNAWADLNVAGTALIFRTNETERMRLASDGNFGIGTTSPSQALHVSGSVRVTGAYYDSNNSAGTSDQILTSTSTGTDWKSKSELSLVDGSGTANYVSKWSDTDTLTDSVIYDNGTNVGVGTSTPSGKFDISASAGSYMFNLTNADEAAFKLRAYNGGSTSLSVPVFTYGLYYSTQENTAIKFYRGGSSVGGFMTFTSSDGAEKMRLSSDGYFGINTTSPSVKLHVQADALGSTAGNQTYAALFQANNGNSSFLEIKDVRTATGSDWTFAGKRIQMRIDSTYMGYVQFNGDSNNGGISFGTGTTTSDPGNVTEKMRINASGNVGIGTTAPTEALHVTGNARVTGSFIDSNNEAGSSGQVLSSTGTGTDWITPVTTTATSLYDLLPAARVAFNWTVQLTAGTWADIFSSTTVLSNGTWMVQAYVDDYAVGGQQYQETYSGVMSWGNANSTNQGGNQAVSEIVLHRSGHAANAGNFYLRTVERVTSTLLFQGMSNLSHTAATTINFKFVKIF